jgi:hypothetical protein
MPVQSQCAAGPTKFQLFARPLLGVAVVIAPAIGDQFVAPRASQAARIRTKSKTALSRSLAGISAGPVGGAIDF